MTSKSRKLQRRKPKRNDNGHEAASDRNPVESLYFELLKQFYENGDRKRAQKVASRLEDALADSPDYAGSIRADEIRSLVAEARGDLAEAARCREAEIRKILELHSLALQTTDWEYVARQYDFSDVSDRLDLLAVLYDELGDVDRAIATLLESKRYCESHGLRFEGQDVLDELERTREAVAETEARGRRGRAVPRDQLDDALRTTYRRFRTSADKIVVDDETARRFTEAVKRQLPVGTTVSVQEVAKRLLTLRRRGEAKGGLPRLGR